MSLDSHLPVLQILVPMLTAPVVTLLRVPSLPWMAATAASLVSVAVAFTLAAAVGGGAELSYALGGWPAPYGIVLHIDALSALLLVVITGASTAALLFGKPSLDQQIGQARAPMFYAAWLLVVAGLCGIVATGDAFNLFVFLEISSLASYILVAAGPDRRALMSTFRYLVLGTVGATFYLIGVGLIYMMTGTLNLADMTDRLHHVADTRPVLAAAAFITVGLALKAGVFPLHGWMPNAYTYAPHAASVFLAACATKAALYVMFRFDVQVFLPHLDGYGLSFDTLIMPLAILAFLVGSAVAVFEGNLKRLLGYSSVAQIGYILLGISLLSTLGVTAGVLHVFNHALIKGTLFMAVACLAFRNGSVRLVDLAGCARSMPWTMGAFVVAGLSVVGVPLTAGFVSKWYLVLACLEYGNLGYLFAALVLASSLMALAYVWRVVETAYFQPRPEGAVELLEAPLVMLVPLWALALANVWFGVDTSFSVGMAQAAAGILLGPSQ